MKGENPRAISLRILNRIEETELHLDQLLTDSFRRYKTLNYLDQAFITELTYGVLRWRERLDWIIRNLSKISLKKIDQPILNILRLGLYQIIFLSKTPPFSAVDESVKLAKEIKGKRGGGFVNAILRSFLRKKEELSYPDLKEDPSLHISVLYSHPLWLVKRWIKEMGVEKTIEICNMNNQITPATIRVNTLKLSREQLMERLGEEGIKVIPTYFSDEGIRIEGRKAISQLPFLKDGLFIIQDEASQLVTTILDPRPGERILDACASPGSKTTHIAQRMKNEGEIYSLDLTEKKLNLIEESCFRLGISIVKTIKGDASKPLTIPNNFRFDRVLVDVPCSGFGTIRKNPDLKWRRNEMDIKRLSLLQYSILNNCSRYIKEGGILVYSTCTIFHEENEDIVEKFLRENLEFQLDSIEEILPEKFHPFIKNGFFKTFPPTEEMDGFFVARMVKISQKNSLKE